MVTSPKIMKMMGSRVFPKWILKVINPKMKQNNSMELLGYPLIQMNCKNDLPDTCQTPNPIFPGFPQIFYREFFHLAFFDHCVSPKLTRPTLFCVHCVPQEGGRVQSWESKYWGEFPYLKVKKLPIVHFMFLIVMKFISKMFDILFMQFVWSSDTQLRKFLIKMRDSKFEK